MLQRQQCERRDGSMHISYTAVVSTLNPIAFCSATGMATSSIDRVKDTDITLQYPSCQIKLIGG